MDQLQAMPIDNVGVYVSRVKNRNGVYSYLVRESFREDGKVKKRTMANITHLPPEVRESIRLQLKGDQRATGSGPFEVIESKAHGHVDAVRLAMKALRFDALVSPHRTRERQLVLGMIAARVLDPGSKLATARSWSATSLPDELGIADATEDDLYRAMDWLLDEQPRIQRKLAKRHLEACGLVLYDLSSSYVEGTKCPLASRGYSRDGKPSKLQVNYGVLADERGCPIAVDVYEGKTADPSTVRDQMVKIKDDFGLDLVVFVGDRGMLAQSVIEELQAEGGFEWISALKSGALRKLHTEGSLQMDLFDKRNLFEFSSPKFPDERLVACRNERLAKLRAHKRNELLKATRAELDHVKKMVKAGRLSDAGQIGIRVGRVLNKYKMAKHFRVEISDGHLAYRTKQDAVRAEAALDGIYVVRTSVPREAIASEDVVRHYKRLTRLERVFRGMKSSGLEVRPIFHRSERRVRAHIFLCMLAEYVQWHMKRALCSFLFANEVDTLESRDPVEPAEPTESALEKKRTKKNALGQTVHSFKTLLRSLSTIVKNTCELDGGHTFQKVTRPTPHQTSILQALEAM